MCHKHRLLAGILLAPFVGMLGVSFPLLPNIFVELLAQVLFARVALLIHASLQAGGVMHV